MRIQRAWRHVALAVATLLPTLVAVAVSTVEPAEADPNPYEWWTGFNGLGLTKLDTHIDIQGSYSNTFVIAHPKQHSSCDSGSNLAGQANDKGDLGGAVQTTFAPGSTAHFCLEVAEGGPSGQVVDTWQTATLGFKDRYGSTLGPSYTMTNPGNWHQMQSPAIPVRFDAKPLDGQIDAPLPPGPYEMFVTLTTQSECVPTACDSHGGGHTSHFGQGYIYVGQGYLFGAHPKDNSASELTQEQASSGINKNMSLVRDYKSDWSVPSARVSTWAAQGKSVVWSAKPPVWNGTQSPWARAAADTAMIDNQIRSLQASANQSGGPAAMFYALSHEPHDNASDTAQGWKNGAADRKCGSTSSPSGADSSHDPCLGTAAQYKALYAAMRDRQQVACNSNGGTSAPYGSPCAKVKLIYIGVTSNISPGPTPGADDLMRPDPEDFDVFGGDVFNWGCFRKSAGTCTDSVHGNNHEWKSFEQLIDDPTASNTFLDLAAYFNKAAIITELGSHPGCESSQTTNRCNGAKTFFSRADWFSLMFNYLSLDVEANKYLVGFSYFHDFQSHDWRFIDTTAGGDVDNRGLAQYTAGIAGGLYRTTAAGYTVQPVPEADFSIFRTASSSTAYNYSWPVGMRNHSGVSVWTPRKLDFNSGWDTVKGNAWMTFGFDWHQPHHKMEIGHGVAFEINAKVDCAWARSFYNYYENRREGYRGEGFQTNIPTSVLALPYEDTIFKESCQDGAPDGRGDFGVGVMNAQNLPTGHYFIRVALDNVNPSNHNPPAWDSVVELRTKVGAVYDSAVLDQANRDCVFDKWERDHWNDPTDEAMTNWRRQAGWCTWIDWSHYIHRSEGTMLTGRFYDNIWLDYLANQGMEEGGATPTAYGLISGGPNASMRRYCNDGWPAFDGSCFVQYNNGFNGQGVSVYQDRVVNATGGYEPTMEVAVRCRSGSSCLVNLSVWGFGPNQEHRNVTSNPIQNDGHWYICRLDSDHGSSPFQSFHQTLRWEVYNLAANGGNIDLDYTFLGGQTKWQNPDKPFLGFYEAVGVGQSSVGDVCTRK